jgi:N-acetylmuramoyl-L-alanine amidase
MNKKYSYLYFPILFIMVYLCICNPVHLFAQDDESGYKLKKVVIDAGHGGKDPGSMGKITTEKKLTLAISLKVGQYIEQQLPEVQVIYTRNEDEFIELHKRAEIANNSKADLFISVHVNGNENKQIDGTESLVLGSHRAGENFEVAKRENSVILLEDNYKEKYEGFDPNSPESYQSFSLMQDLYFKKSIMFAGLVQEQFRERAQRKDRSVRQQGLLVLAQTAMPGVLIETGFITNPDEEKYLITEQGQDFIASAIFRAFREYKNLSESNASVADVSQGQLNDHETGSPDDNHNRRSDSVNVASVEKPAPSSPPAVEFKVQIAASKKPIAEEAIIFEGLTNISEYYIDNLYKYAVGSSTSFQDILAYSRQVKERFPDAFIIAVKNNKIIPLDQALRETQMTNSKN